MRIRQASVNEGWFMGTLLQGLLRPYLRTQAKFRAGFLWGTTSRWTLGYIGSGQMAAVLKACLLRLGFCQPF